MENGLLKTMKCIFLFHIKTPAYISVECQVMPSVADSDISKMSQFELVITVL